MNIRKLEQKDKEQMLVLMEEFWLKNQRGEILSGELKEISELKDPQAQMKVELEQYFNWITFVAEDASKLLGFVSASIKVEEDLVLDKTGYVEELFVTEAARGKKLGLVLMEKVLVELEVEGCVVFRTSVYKDNPIAHSLYRKLGFVDESVELTRKVKR